jgi:hypothetical protein
VTVNRLAESAQAMVAVIRTAPIKDANGLPFPNSFPKSAASDGRVAEGARLEACLGETLTWEPSPARLLKLSGKRGLRGYLRSVADFPALNVWHIHKN